MSGTERLRWLRLARKDVGDAMRSWSLYGTVGLFLAVGGLLGYFAGGPVAGQDAQSPVLGFTTGLLTLLVPVVALGLTYESVAGPRSDGSLQFLLALPYSRRDVVLGTYAGRVVVLATGLGAGYLAVALAMLVHGVVVSPVTLLLVLDAAVVLGVAFVAIGVGISTAVRSTTAAGALAFVAFFLVFFLWQSLPGLLAYLLNGFSQPPAPPSWAPVVLSLNPLVAFQVLVSSVAGSAESASIGFGAGAVRSLPFALAVLAGWATLPPLAGYLRFRNDDL